MEENKAQTILDDIEIGKTILDFATSIFGLFEKKNPGSPENTTSTAKVVADAAGSLQNELGGGAANTMGEIKADSEAIGDLIQSAKDAYAAIAPNVEGV
jgi:hypothetical protein